MKVAIVVDSSCGLTQEEAKQRGWYYLPIQIDIDNKIFKDGVDVDYQSIFDHIKKNSRVLTSATLLGQAINLIDNLQKEYDKIIIYPISQKLSSQYQMLKMAFVGNEKVYVIPSQKISLPIIMELSSFEALLKKSKYEEALKVFNQSDNNIYLVPENGEALVRGGRLTPTAASIAKLLKIVPIIEFKNGELIKYGKGRVFDKTIIKLAKEIYVPELSKNLILINANNENIEKLAHDILNNLDIDEIYITNMPPTISVHAGNRAVALLYAKTHPTELEILNQHMKKITKNH
ncbi:DegV family protein [Mycoplasma miroungirhinis]|uniref:DegV family protein n=1 Tax=Mycoplasma miroungirhinis TaxID=754516 RepID=A0A6M4JC00_9MOLU|nr:DegV family protein [Mycoplasma miroungirhinis]QJR43875.1 DegV family protein [Mycoplasma miroungirhinis]